MRVVEDVYARVDILQEKVRQKNYKSDFAIKIRDDKWALQKEALTLINIIILLKDSRVPQYKTKLMATLTEIERMQGR